MSSEHSTSSSTSSPSSASSQEPPQSADSVHRLASLPARSGAEGSINGWQGDYITWAHIEAEAELARLKDGKFYVIGANSLFQDNLAVHKQIAEAAKQGNARYPAQQMTEGWVGGLVLATVLKTAGWPADAAKIRAAMEQVKVDTEGLRGGPIEWSKDNHFRTRQYYRVYRWDPAKSAITVTKDWVAYDVK